MANYVTLYTVSIQPQRQVIYVTCSRAFNINYYLSICLISQNTKNYIELKLDYFQYKYWCNTPLGASRAFTGLASHSLVP